MEWIPAHDPYTGTPVAAIMAYAEIPLPERRELVRRATLKIPDYEDVVYADRDSIRGKYRYEDHIWRMHFGSRGRIEDEVTRKSWPLDHVESGMVFCGATTCVVRWSVCNNWSIITRIHDETHLPLPPLQEPSPSPEPSRPYEQVTWGGDDDPDGDWYSGSPARYWPTPTTGIGNYHYGHPSPIPEPTIAGLLASGLVGVAFLSRRRLTWKRDSSV